MSRKSVLVTGGVLLLAVGGLAAGLTLVLRYEPRFYRDKEVAPGLPRKLQSTDFKRNLANLFTAITVQDRSWQVSFSEGQINSYFEEEFVPSGAAAKVLPEEVSAPRVALEGDTIRLAFRYGEGPWSTIISADVRPWLTKELNVVALELQGLHAGSLPISAQSLLEQIAQVARRQNIEVSWYRHNNNPVALLRFLSQNSRPTVHLRHLKIADGTITFAGECSQPVRPVEAVNQTSPVEAPPSAN